MIRLRFFLLLMLLAKGAFAQQQEFMQGQLFVKLKDSDTQEILYKSNDPVLFEDDTLNSIIIEYKIKTIESPFILDDPKLQKIYLVTFTDTAGTDALIRNLQKLKYIEYVERVPLYSKQYTPDDLHPNQWGLPKVQADLAWDISNGSALVKIAIVDNAVSTTHEDLVPNLWINPLEIPGNSIDDDTNGFIDDVNGYDVADNDNNPNPPFPTNGIFAHGTHCAGIASAATDNAKGIASLGFKAKIIAVKTATDASSGWSIAAGYAGIEYAIIAGADVISMSWGGYSYSLTYQILFDVAYDKGIVCIAAAGNSNTDIPMYPASYSHVISVGASDIADKKASFSNYGDSIDVMAPGVGIWSCLAGSDSAYGYLSGTSMACPMVSGLAALMLAKNPLLVPDSLEYCLKISADNIDILNPGYAGKLGAGRINAYNALLCFSPIYVDFTSNYTRTCPGDTVRFTDKTAPAPTSWQWTFPGGTPSVSTLQNPVVVYSAPGTYSVTLIAANANGSDTIIKTNYITAAIPAAIISGSATIALGYSANLKVDLTGNPQWTIIYNDGTTNYSVNNITNTPYYITVSPVVTTTYTLVSVSDNGCAGGVSGSAVITVSSMATPCPMVKTFQKISSTQGGFTGILDNSDFFGISLASIGDLDGDGITDFVVGADQDDDGGTDKGAVWIVFLNSNGTVKSYQKISNTVGGFTGILNNVDNFGFSVSSIGDLNGDGITDIAVTAHTDDDGGADKGAVWILFLNTNGTVKKCQKISDTQGNFSGVLDIGDEFGTAVASIGDLDGDSVKDIAVAAYNDDDGGTDRGAVWILFLDTNGNVKSHQKISNTQGNFTGILDNSDNLGTSITSLGDLNSDGITDIVVGASGDDDGGTNRGAVWILFLDTNGSVKSHQKISNTQGNFTGILDNSDFFGRSTGLLPDLNGDNIIELSVGAWKDDDGGVDRGALWILHLNKNGTVNSHLKISNTQGGFTGILNNSNAFGHAVAYAGDLDGNGIGDLAIAAPGDDDGGTDRGAVWILFMQDTCSIPPDTSNPVNPPTCSIKSDFSSTLVCLGDSTSFTDLSKDSNATIIIWKWYFGDGDSLIGVQNPKHKYSAAGTYSATLIAGTNDTAACFDTITKSVTVVNTFFVFALPDDTICTDDTIILALADTLCGKTPFKYSWSPSTGLSDTSSSAPKASPSVNTTYIITVTDADSLSAKDTVTIFVNTSCCKSYAAIGGADSLYCFSDSVFLMNQSQVKSGASYQWNFGTNANPSTYSGANPPLVYFNNYGSHPITLIVTDSCGIDTAFKNILIFSPPISDAGSDSLICINDSIQLGATPIATYGYLWSPSLKLSDTAIANPRAWIDSTITYYLKVTDNTTLCVAYDTIKLTRFNIPLFSLGDDTVFCKNDSLVLIGTYPSSTYLWQDNSTDPEYTVKTSGIYWVKITNKCGVLSDTIAATIAPELTINLGKDTTICDDIIALNAGTSGKKYLWSNGDTNNAIIVTAQGNYFVTVTSTYGCKTTDTIVVGKCIRTIIPPNTITPNGDGSNDIWIIQFIKDYPGNKVTIYNRNGNIVYETTNYQNDWSGKWNGQELPAATYYYVMDLNNGDVYKGTITIIRDR